MSELRVCPECRTGKHQNCDGTAWDNDTDAPGTCTCTTGEHPRNDGAGGDARKARAEESVAGVEGGRMRGTGGNRFIGPEATSADLLRSINDQLGDLREYATETGRIFDVAEVTISTKRTQSGRISVSVTADLGVAQ